MTGEKVLKKVAKRNGVSVVEVRQEITNTINATFENPNPLAQEMLKKIPMKGSMPTPEEFIEFISKQVKSNMETQCF